MQDSFGKTSRKGATEGERRTAPMGLTRRTWKSIELITKRSTKRLKVSRSWQGPEEALVSLSLRLDLVSSRPKESPFTFHFDTLSAVPNAPFPFGRRNLGAGGSFQSVQSKSRPPVILFCHERLGTNFALFQGNSFLLSPSDTCP